MDDLFFISLLKTGGISKKNFMVLKSLDSVTIKSQLITNVVKIFSGKDNWLFYLYSKVLHNRKLTPQKYTRSLPTRNNSIVD